MIDKSFQQKGYGKLAMKLLLDVKKESVSAVKLYEGFGFKFTGQVLSSSHIMELEY